MSGGVTLAELHDQQLEAPEPVVRSGRQELLEDIVARSNERSR